MSALPVAFMPQRVAEIQQRFGLAPVRTEPTSTQSNQFASTLDQVMSGFGATASSVDGNDVVATASKYLGIPYVWGGTDPSTGLDCSGLVQRVFKDLGIDLPRVSRDQAKQGTEIASIEDAKPGDLLAFGSPVDHIGIYVGDNKMLHAPRTGDVVKVGPIYRPIATIRRITPDNEPTAAISGASGLGLNAAMLNLATPNIARPGASTGIAGAEPFESVFNSAATKYGFNPRLLAAIAKTESNFNPTATSPAGARGLMQFMPGTARGLGIDPLDPSQAIDGAARYLRQQYDKFGSIELALAAYNAGPGNVSKYGGIPPFTETRNYVTKVTGLLAGQSALAPALAS